MDKNDLAVGLKNVIAEGDAIMKEFLSLIDKEDLENLYDSMDEYLVALENADEPIEGDLMEDDGEELEEDEEEDEEEVKQ
jgi:hypothetical protein